MNFRLKLTLLVCIVCGRVSPALQAQQAPVPDAYVATAWADLTVQTMTRAMKNTPTYGSRALGYLGLTMYETVVPGSKQYRSIARSLCDTLRLPSFNNALAYSPELALNAGQAHMLKALYNYTRNTERIDSLFSAIHQLYAARYQPAVVARSEQYGKAVAETIYRWSLSDGGDQAQERNFPAGYVLPKGTGFWTPPLIGQVKTKIPMHPSWGQNRPFAVHNGQLPVPKPLLYSVDTASAFYKQNLEVWQRSQHLSDAEREIVLWWGDDPNQTCSPPGHSYYFATLAVRKSRPDLVKAAQTYCRVGMAVADAFIVCWKAKFTHMVERPSSFIFSVIKPLPPPLETRWYPFFPEPPFPSFYSGHAVQSAAAATVLTEMYGNNFSFTDDIHVTRPVLGYVYLAEGYTLTFRPRSYSSFWAAARECAESRLLGGIHTRQDNETGLKEGTKIGQNINALRWK